MSRGLITLLSQVEASLEKAGLAKYVISADSTYIYLVSYLPVGPTDEPRLDVLAFARLFVSERRATDTRARARARTRTGMISNERFTLTFLIARIARASKHDILLQDLRLL